MSLLRLALGASLRMSVILARWLRPVWYNSYLLTAVVEGFWLSLLPDSLLKKTIGLSYKKSQKYLTDQQASSGLFDWEKSLFAKYVPNGAKVVVIGAGNGREAIALTKLGYGVEAFEMNQAFVNHGLDYCKRNGMDFRFEHLPDNRMPQVVDCDVFLVGWGVYTHLIGRSNRIDFLRQISGLLSPNGVVIISFWSHNRDDKYVRTIRRTSKVLNLRQVEDGESIFGRFWGKYYTHQQINAEAAMAGYRLGYIGMEPYGHALLMPVTNL